MKTIKPSIKNLPSIVAATLDLERWKAQQISIVRGDLVLKHRMMADAVFPFMRSTFYRWAQLWPMVCPELARAPQVLAVGDLHVENFGTWRDLEGRLVWGVNDFDEAWPAAYASDLVRLLVSAYYAIGEEKLLVTRAAAREAIEAGYRDAMDKGGSPYVLAERHTWLRQIALSKLRDPVRFWQKIETCPDYRGKVPKLVADLLLGCMPVKDAAMQMKARIAGLGSLGHARILALFQWHGAHIVREAKALTRSGWIWASGEKSLDAPLLQEQIISSAVRVRDPHLHFHDNWVIRRQIAAALSWLPCPSNATKSGCCMQWAGKPRTSIWAALRKSAPLKRICGRGGADGCTKPPKPWLRELEKTGRFGEKRGRNGTARIDCPFERCGLHYCPAVPRLSIRSVDFRATFAYRESCRR